MVKKAHGAPPTRKERRHEDTRKEGLAKLDSGENYLIDSLVACDMFFKKKS